MTEAKAVGEWAQTSAVLALIANAHRDPKKSRVFTPLDFNPLEARKRKQVTAKTNDLSFLKTVFVDNRKET